MTFPENHHAYRAGTQARHKDYGRTACPYGPVRLYLRSLWLAGWHDADMELSQ